MRIERNGFQVQRPLGHQAQRTSSNSGSYLSQEGRRCVAPFSNCDDVFTRKRLSEFTSNRLFDSGTKANDVAIMSAAYIGSLESPIRCFIAAINQKHCITLLLLINISPTQLTI